MVPAAEVRAAIARHLHSSHYVARDFAVAERTVRRWQLTGLPLTYGAADVSLTEWTRYAETGSSGRTRKPKRIYSLLDQAAADVVGATLKPVRLRPPVDPSRPKKRLRLASERLREWKRR